VDELHKLLFAVDSFEQMYDAMREAERRTARGSL
jgi:phenylalanine-4-hydroxylase